MSWTDQLFRWLGHGRVNAAPVPAGDGQVTELRASPTGELMVRLAGGGATAPSYHRSSGSKGALVRSGPGALIGCRGFNAGTSPCYVLLIDRGSAPVNGLATVYESFLVPAGGSFGFQAEEPIPCSSGLAWAASSTSLNVTLIPGNDVSIVVAYQ